MILENWSIVGVRADVYTAPELAVPCLVGQVYGHPHYHDGKSIRSSSISYVSGNFVTTSSGSVYELGEVDPNYEDVFPNALKHLQEDLLWRNYE